MKEQDRQAALDALDAIGSRMCILDGTYAWNDEFDTIRAATASKMRI